MEIIFIKNFTIELKDKSAGLFRAGQVAEFDSETAKEVVNTPHPKGWGFYRFYEEIVFPISVYL